MDKTFSEFRRDFDLMYNNISNAAAPGYTDDEIWQMAQIATEKVCLSVYDGTLKANGFEVTEEVTSYINGLTKQIVFQTRTEGTSITENDNNYYFNEDKSKTILDIQEEDFGFYSKICELATDFWFIVYESVKLKESDDCFNGKTITVKPVTHDSLYRIMQNPFVGRNFNYALRLLTDNKVELITYKHEIDKYLVRYMSKPKFFTGELINNNDKILEDINDSLYIVIMEQTVNIAKTIWAS